MSIIAVAVKHLIAACVTGDALVTAIAEMEQQICDKPKQRTSGALRQERYRRNKASQSVTTVTCDDKASQSVTCDAGGDPSLSLPPNENNSNPPTHTHPDNNTRARKGCATSAPAKPDGVTDQTWIDFLDLRKRKRANLTQTALDAITDQAKRAGWSLEAALVECVTSGWQAFKADWVKDRARPMSHRSDHHALVAHLPERIMTEFEARALMDDIEFERWKRKQRQAA